MDAHQLKLARLEWELTQRKQLAALCDELSDSKKGVAASIETKQERLDNLGPQLRTILEASKPLQDSFGLPLDKIHQEHQKAALLVSPLYVLYAKSSAYRDAYGNIDYWIHFEIEIVFSNLDIGLKLLCVRIFINENGWIIYFCIRRTAPMCECRGRRRRSKTN